MSCAGERRRDAVVMAEETSPRDVRGGGVRDDEIMAYQDMRRDHDEHDHDEEEVEEHPEDEDDDEDEAGENMQVDQASPESSADESASHSGNSSLLVRPIVENKSQKR